MEYRTLGRTGLRVSEVGFGCGNVGGLLIRGAPADRVKAVARALELGINYFDTAPSYGDGQSETNLGQVFRELRPDAYVGTKVRLSAQDMGDIKGAVVRSLEESLRRLGRDSVDLVQLHNRVGLERDISRDLLSVEDVLGPVVEAFQLLQGQGKARFYGITGFGETRALHQVVEAGAVYTVQACYNLLNPSAGAPVPAGFPLQDFQGLVDRAAETQTGVIGIRVLAAGALSGAPERHPVAVPMVAPMGSGRDYNEDLRRAGEFRFLVDEGHVENLIEAALRFTLGHRGVSTALVGYSSLDHLEQSVKYADRGPLPPAALARLPGIWSRW